jgi:hypothetical protein
MRGWTQNERPTSVEGLRRRIAHVDAAERSRMLAAMEELIERAPDGERRLRAEDGSG